MRRSAANLCGWLHEPFVKNAVIAVLTSADHPLLMREVADGCDIPVRCANRVLLRLHNTGHVTRYKLPIQRPGYCHKRKACIAGAATRKLFVYSWAYT